MKAIRLVGFLLFFFVTCTDAQSQSGPFRGNKTLDYGSLIKEYRKVDTDHKMAKLIDFGTADVGKPLQLLIIDKSQSFDVSAIKASQKAVLLINNGIHPGEACGIDASLLLVKELLKAESELHQLLDDVVVLVIPAYNIGGMLNRGSFSRANQNGPEAYGFRGNAKNLDLNRDFIKCDSKNAASFNQMYHKWSPDVYAETHTTNGSDHQYTLTLISSQEDKLQASLAQFQTNIFVPQLFKAMKAEKKEMTPYVYPIKQDPKDGIKAFLETPRYSTGYTALHHSLGFITEAHVFKPYEARVNHTYAFLKTLLNHTAKHKAQIKAARKAAKTASREEKFQSIDWKLDSSSYRQINFKGYERAKKISEITANEMHFYDQSKPYEKTIPFYGRYQSRTRIKKPQAYVIPQAYRKVIERLKWNGVKMSRLEKDQVVYLSYYKIENYKTLDKAYEGHYLHYDISVSKEKDSLQLFEGDYVVSTGQEADNYLVHVLEPQSVDGFFAWNFFDGILQQKEWFSDYAFEPKAKEILANNPEIRAKFKKAKQEDSLLRKNNFAQLYFIYKLSPYYESTVNRFPIYRIETKRAND
ncbi:MAG: M14 family zinc carboxypeptidase [Vicingaceae bacterium]